MSGTVGGKGGVGGRESLGVQMYAPIFYVKIYRQDNPRSVFSFVYFQK